MTDVIINASLNGPAVEQGGVEWRRLVQFGDALQKAIDRMAYSLEKEQGARRKFNEVLADTKLRLLDTKHGSFEMTQCTCKDNECFMQSASEGRLKIRMGILNF